jgi:hypothetical protein
LGRCGIMDGLNLILVQIIEFLGKILLEDYTLTYFEPKCAKDLELLCQKIGLFYKTKKPLQNAILSIFFTHGRQTWSSKIPHNF